MKLSNFLSMFVSTRFRPVDGDVSTSPSPSTVIASANAVSNIFDELHLPTRLPDVRLPNVELEFYSADALPEPLRDWMFSCARSLRPMYEASAMGWDSSEKRRELRHAKQRFLVAKCRASSHQEDAGTVGADAIGATPLVGFVSFRWDIEEGVPVFYLYELFVEKAARGFGIAGGLMRFAERLSVACGVFCIMLTVFDANIAAKNLYRRCLQYVFKSLLPFFIFMLLPDLMQIFLTVRLVLLTCLFVQVRG